MRIQTIRPDAVVEAQENGYFSIRAVLCQEFLAHGGRVVVLYARTELSFRPGVIYKAFTGIALPDVPNSASLLARATAAAWKHGLIVHRVEFEGDLNELVVYFTVTEGFEFYRTQPLVEVAPILAHEPRFVVGVDRDGQIDTAKAPAIEVIKGPEAPPPGPQKSQEEGLKLAEPRKKGEAAPADDPEASDAAKVRNWLNEPDEKGKIVAQGKDADDVTRQARQGNVQPVSEKTAPMEPGRSEAVIPEEPVAEPRDA